MTTYTYPPMPVFGTVGSLVKFGGPGGVQASVVDMSGNPVTCVQGGNTYSGYIVTNADGTISAFTSTSGPALVMTLNGFTFTLTANELWANIVTSDQLTAAVNAAVAGVSATGWAQIVQNGDGTWPARTTVTADRTVVLAYIVTDVTKLPATASVASTGSPLPTPNDQFIYSGA